MGSRLLGDLLGDNQPPGPWRRPSNFLIKYSSREEKDAIDGMIWHNPASVGRRRNAGRWEEKQCELQLISALIREQSHNMIISVCSASCFIRHWSWTADQAVAISPPAAPHSKYSFKTILARGEWRHICESLGSEIDVLLKLLRCPVGEKLVTLKYFFLNVFRVHKSLGKTLQKLQTMQIPSKVNTEDLDNSWSSRRV